MARIFLTRNIKNKDDPKEVAGDIEGILQDLENQLNDAPAIWSRTGSNQPLPQSPSTKDVLLDMATGNLRIGLYDGIQWNYISLASLSGTSITEDQHGALGRETTDGDPLHTSATTSEAGFMSAADKTALDNAITSVSVDDALEGDGSPGDPLNVKVDGVTVIVNGSNELQATGGATGVGALIGLQTITTTGAGTYTPTAGTNTIIIEGQGGGGGGGGVSSPASSNWALARAGQGGGWFRKRLTADFSGASYSVGVGGTGGTAGNNAGNNGGNTTFTDTSGAPVTYTAGGGAGGTGSASLGSAPIKRDSMFGGGISSNGDLNQDGWVGIPAIALSSSVGTGGYGANSKYGCGGFQAGIITNGTQAGGNASGHGGGGGGAAANGSGAAAAGGNGSDGVLIIWEYA